MLKHPEIAIDTSYFAQDLSSKVVFNHQVFI